MTTQRESVGIGSSRMICMGGDQQYHAATTRRKLRICALWVICTAPAAIWVMSGLVTVDYVSDYVYFDNSRGICHLHASRPFGQIGRVYHRSVRSEWTGVTLWQADLQIFPSGIRVEAPIWIGAVPGVAALSVWSAVSRFRCRRTGERRRCPKCGYDLTGNVSGVCPECGARR